MVVFCPDCGSSGTEFLRSEQLVMLGGKSPTFNEDVFECKDCNYIFAIRMV